MRTALLLLLALAAPAFAAQTVWKWVDEKGVTHYSDRPVPGATKVEVSVGNRWKPSEPTTSAPPAAREAANGPVYRDFVIWKPSNEEVFINTGGQVTVNIRLEPALQDGHSLNLYLDGKLLEGYPENATSYELTELPRGTHSVVATVNDYRGNRIQETAPVVFTVRQESIANPPVGPALRPPPKPQPRGANKLPSRQPSYADLNGARAPLNPVTNAPVVTKPKPATQAPKAGG